MRIADAVHCRLCWYVRCEDVAVDIFGVLDALKEPRVVLPHHVTCPHRCWIRCCYCRGDLVPLAV
jgi:hypothetical protein